MKNTNKGFTLVELIVVITILAILGTIAFISLQGYSQDAKNSKVTSDIRTLATAVETKLTDGTITAVANIGDNTLSGSNVVDAAPFDNSGATLTVGTNYKVGKIDFAKLRQNGSDFKDSDGNDYIVATAVNGKHAFYQIAGQKANADGTTYEYVVQGNYVKIANNDAEGLISASSSTGAIQPGESNSGPSLY